MSKVSSARRRAKGTVVSPAAWPYLATAFVSAFLLFQVQLIMGKHILPWFGGTPGVWTACLLVFQLLLLAGYVYSHVLVTRVPAAAQTAVHLGVLGLSLAVLGAMAFAWPSPILPGAAWKPDGGGAPEWLIVRLLVVTVGLPFLVLSTTAPLIQRWFGLRFPGASPYRLYAVSNLGSLLGLLAYPFVVERALRLHAQGTVWAIGYAAFAALVFVCAPRRRGDASEASRETTADDDAEGRQSRGRYGVWLALSATASTMLMAVTNHVCQELAVVALLWVLPLTLYLLSFVLCFQGESWYPRATFHALYALAAVLMVGFHFTDFGLTTRGQIAAFLLILYVCCMVCHGELYRLRPAPRHLTSFYLATAAGGAIGGLFVGIAAPRVFPGFWELPIGFLATGALLVGVVWTDESSWLHRSSWRRTAAVAATAVFVILFLTPQLFPAWREGLLWIAGGIAVALIGIEAVAKPRPASLRAVCALRLIVIALLLITAATLAQQTAVRDLQASWQGRNFYGVLSIRRYLSTDSLQDAYVLHHGRTMHGLQFMAASRSATPTGYYRPQSGIGRAIRSHPRLGSGLRLGVIGLGIGSLAGYGLPGDSVRFYEINPAVIDVAEGRHGSFSMLSGSRAQVTVVPGDARLALEQEGAQGQRQGFDILAIDAFNSDAIPVHLITREALQLYRLHLREAESLLAFHITNRSVDLGPVLARLAEAEGLHAVRVHSEDVGSLEPGSAWVLISAAEASLRRAEIAAAAMRLSTTAGVPLWTDDYSNLVQIMNR